MKGIAYTSVLLGQEVLLESPPDWRVGRQSPGKGKENSLQERWGLGGGLGLRNHRRELRSCASCFQGHDFTLECEGDPAELGRMETGSCGNAPMAIS